MAREIISGIYVIKNVINNKVYIGSSVDIHERILEHKRKLNRNIHHNRHLQNSWNKYGASNFEFSKLEICNERSKLIDREQFWIDKTKCTDRNYGYNINIIANSPKGLNLSNEIKEYLRSISKSKQVLQFTMNGEFVKEWIGAKTILKETGYDIVSIIKNKNNYTSHGFIWIYKDEYEKSGLTIKPIKYSKMNEIVQLDKDLNIVANWRNLKHIQDELGYDNSYISKCCRLEKVSYKGFYWLYKIDYNNGVTPRVSKRSERRKPIVQLDIDGNLIKVWESITEASLSIANKIKCSISDCLRKKQDFAYGYKWEYKYDYDLSHA